MHSVFFEGLLIVIFLIDLTIFAFKRGFFGFRFYLPVVSILFSCLKYLIIVVWFWISILLVSMSEVFVFIGFLLLLLLLILQHSWHIWVQKYIKKKWNCDVIWNFCGFCLKFGLYLYRPLILLSLVIFHGIFASVCLCISSWNSLIKIPIL